MLTRCLLTLLMIVGGWTAWSPPVYASCEVHTSAPTYTDLTFVGADLCDTHANKGVILGSLLAGEDLTATGGYSGGVIVTEQRYLTAGVKTADFQVKGSAGFLNCIIIAPADGAPTAGQIDIYDNTAESGTKIFHYEVVVATMFAPIQICPNVVMATGIYLGFTTTADVNVTVTYR